MGNSSTSFLPEFSCSDNNVSKNFVTPEYWESHSISDDFRIATIIEAFILLLFVLIGIPCNILIVFSIIKQELYKHTTHILLLNLAISDLLTCLLVFPPVVVAGFSGGYIYGESDYVRCQVCSKTGLILTAMATFSVNILGLISLDRFIFIKFPLHYDRYVTMPRVISAAILLWLISTIEAILPLLRFGEIAYAYSVASCTINLIGHTNLYYSILVIGLALIPIALTIITNVWIACIVRVQIRKIYRTRRSFGNRQQLEEYNQKFRKEIRGKRTRKQLIMVQVFGSIIFANFITWTPLVVLVILSAAVDEDSIPLGVYIFPYLSFLSHSILHPMIEGCIIPEIKHTFKKAFGIELCEKAVKKSETGISDASCTYTRHADKQFCHYHGCCEICMFAMISDLST